MYLQYHQKSGKQHTGNREKACGSYSLCNITNVTNPPTSSLWILQTKACSIQPDDKEQSDRREFVPSGRGSFLGPVGVACILKGPKYFKKK